MQQVKAGLEGSKYDTFLLDPNVIHRLSEFVLSNSDPENIKLKVIVPILPDDSQSTSQVISSPEDESQLSSIPTPSSRHPVMDIQDFVEAEAVEVNPSQVDTSQ